jgi:hypothetical protein
MAKTYEDVEKEIHEKSGVDANDLPFVNEIQWFTQFGKSSWKRGQPVPGNDKLAVFAAFDGDSCWRVYAVPVGEKAVPTRIALTKTASTFSIEYMTWDVFQQEIVDELQAQAGADDDTDECPKCGAENPVAALYCNTCGEKFPDVDEDDLPAAPGEAPQGPPAEGQPNPPQF